MADNVAITAGSGTSVATDDIASVHYQRVKLSLGADGTAVDAVAGAGAVSSAVQRVTLASDDPAVVALQALDNAVAGNELQVDIVSGTANLAAAATGGYTPGKLVSAASTNATNVKASAGTVGFICAFNTNAAARYLKLYNKASSPTVGTDTPVQVYTIPGNTAGAGVVLPLPPQGLNFSTGISLALTTGAADSDTGAVAASEIVVSYGYA